MSKWIAVKERESQQWFIAGQTEWYQEEYLPPGRRRYQKRAVQKTWVFPKPEHVSPFIEAHKVVDAATKEEAECLISSWR
jgi:hypothetical protein